MAGGGNDPGDTPIGELLGRLVDDGKAYARAEYDLVRANAEAKAEAAKKPLILGAAAALFLQAAVVVLGMTIALALATLVGPLAGGLIATLLTLGIAALLFWLAKREYERRP